MRVRIGCVPSMGAGIDCTINGGRIDCVSSMRVRIDCVPSIGARIDCVSSIGVERLCTINGG